ncbi:putative cytochrome P450 [Helianthus annuus]|nr:putative cytochrome P450 [Helianthus annuus]
MANTSLFLFLISLSYNPINTNILPYSFNLSTMEDTTFIILIVSLFTATFIIHKLFRRSNGKKLPPGPSFITSNYLLFTNPLLQFEPVLKNLKAQYGPFFTLSTCLGPAIFISDHSLAHQVLIQNGAVFSDRPKSFPMCNISGSSYGPTWRLFRRNLASEFMHRSRIKSYSWARKWVLQVFFGRLLDHKNEATGMIKVVDHIRYAMFCLLVLICFGEKFEESRINEIAKVQRDMLLKVSSGRFGVFNVFPRLGKMLFRNRWKEFEKLCSDKEDVLIPIIKSRIESDGYEVRNVAYVDTLVNLRLPEEEGGNRNGGKLSYKEMVSMCSEFFNSGTDTTSTALQWIMANLVKYPHIQRKLYDEIVGVVGAPPPPPASGVEPEAVINEEDIEKMVYLKAVVLEGLRRHPPVHFVLPHRVMKEVEVQGYRIPQGASINFMVGEMGLDTKVWEDPMEFKPERFLVNDGVFDVSGSKGVKMMPFGVGRRMCPGYDLALFHLQYFVANSIWYFGWIVPDGYDVDLSEEVELTVVMKNPLRTQISSRAEKQTT